jgi:hypothetical protein
MDQKLDSTRSPAGRSSTFLNFTLLYDQLVYPYRKALFSIMLPKGPKYEELRIQECRFYGKKEFLSMCVKAMETLHGLDGQLYQSMMRLPYVFWDEPKGSWWFKLHCGIGPEYMAWKEQGIIVSMVHASTLYELLYISSSRQFRREAVKLLKQNRVFGRTRDWLAKHEFPQELVRIFA